MGRVEISAGRIGTVPGGASSSPQEVMVEGLSLLSLAGSGGLGEEEGEGGRPNRTRKT